MVRCVVNSLSFRLFHILAGTWRRRYIIATPILILPIIGLLVGLLSQKNYESHTSMLIQETAKMNPFLEDLAVSSMLKERMDTLKTLLHSRHILASVAQERGLIDDKTPPEKYDTVIQDLSTALAVHMAGKDLIRIDYKSNDPEGMKETLEVISLEFIEQLLAPERSSMTDSSNFLADHLNERRKELDQAELALANFRSQHANELPELHLSNMSRLAQLKQRLSERKAELAGASKSLGSLDQQLSKTNPVVGQIEENIIRIRGELALLRARYTDKHSAVEGALRNLRRLEEERRKVLIKTDAVINTEQLWDIASSAQINVEKEVQPLLISQLQNLQLARSRVDGLREEIISLKRMISKLETQAAEFGSHEQELAILIRDQKVKHELYDDLLKRYEMARVTSSLSLFEQEKRVKIIDRPYRPTSPSNLPISLFIIAGFIGGLFLGIGLALILELTDSTIRRHDRLEMLTSTPVISRIPALTPLTE